MSPLFLGRISITRLLLFLALTLFFLISITAAGYVIFFRVVVAAELEQGGIKPTLAIIIDDMGNEREIGKALIDLELNLTFSFLPHAPFLQELETEAGRRGKTIMLHLPLEPIDTSKDPGPGAIYLDEHTGSIEDLFRDNLARVSMATGVNNHMGSRFTRNQPAMERVADLLMENQLFFIDSYTTQGSRAMATVARKGVPAFRGHLFIDNIQQEEAVCSRLQELVGMAQRQQSAIGIGHPHRATFEALQNCGPEILAPVELIGAGELAKLQSGEN